MESFCKIAKILLWGFFFTNTIECVGQNTYNYKIKYYNMDTLRCAESDSRLGDGDNRISNSGNSDSSWLYCIFKKNIDIPIVTVNDVNLIHLLDSFLFEASKWNYLQFPDSSGYFVELCIYDIIGDTSKMGLSITPINNYYMAEILSGFRDDAYNEWFGYNEKNIQGCFFMNNILFVINSYGWVAYDRASCLFTKTDSTFRLSLYSPITTIRTNDIWFKEEFFFQVCVHK